MILIEDIHNFDINENIFYTLGEPDEKSTLAFTTSKSIFGAMECREFLKTQFSVNYIKSFDNINVVTGDIIKKVRELKVQHLNNIKIINTYNYKEFYDIIKKIKEEE